MHLANERWCYTVRPSLIGWVQTENDPCLSTSWVSSVSCQCEYKHHGMTHIGFQWPNSNNMNNEPLGACYITNLRLHLNNLSLWKVITIVKDGFTQSGWLPWSSLEMLKLVFNVFINDWGSHPDDFSISVYTVYPKKYAHGFVVLCFVVVMQSFIMNSHEVFIHIHQGCFAGTGAIVRLPQCQWSKPDGYGKISQCITTAKHSKAKTVCIFLGIYCTSNTDNMIDIKKDFYMKYVVNNLIGNVSTLLQVMALYHQVTSHYLNWDWCRSQIWFCTISRVQQSDEKSISKIEYLMNSWELQSKPNKQENLISYGLGGLDQLERLEPLCSEDTPGCLMITHSIESYWIPSEKKTKSKLQI